MARLPVALHQRMADKQLAAQQRIDGAVIDLARRDDRQTEQRDLFAGHHRPLRLRPVRFAVAVFHQVLSQRLDPFRFDARGDAPPQAAGFHQFGHHGHFGGFLNRPEPGKIEKRALRAPVYSCLSASFWPMCDNRPVSSAVWTLR